VARFSGQDNIFRVLNFFQASQRYELFKCLLFAVVHVGLTIVVRVIALVCMRINDGIINPTDNFSTKNLTNTENTCRCYDLQFQI